MRGGVETPEASTSSSVEILEPSPPESSPEEAVTAYSDQPSGTCGENLTWELVDGTLTIRGSGRMDDYYVFSSSEAPPWYAYRENIKTVTILEGVTSIGYMAFFYCISLTSISIPDSVTSIEDAAFGGCRSLTSISIPNGVTSIGEAAFSSCRSLTSISIPNGVTSIEDNAFSECESLTSISIPNSVTSIGYGAFSNCISLTSISIPNSVTSIGYMAFYSCKRLASISIPNSVTSIEGSAFAICFSLTSISLPDSVTSIEGSTFWLCKSLTSISIPNSVTSIGYGTFADCFSLTDVYYGGSESDWANINIDNGYNGNEALTNATIHYNSKSASRPQMYTVNVPKDQSAVCVIDGDTKEKIPNAVVSIGATDYTTDEKGVCYTAKTGEQQIGVEKEGYTSASAYKKLQNGKCVTISMYSSTGGIKIQSASLEAAGKTLDLLNGTAYLIHKDKIEEKEDGYAEAVLKVRASGNVKKYQMLQNGKVIEEIIGTEGTFKIPVVAPPGESGAIYTKKLSAGYKIHVRAFDEKGKYEDRCLGVKISETSSFKITSEVKDLDMSVAKLSVTIPDNIPFFGGSAFDTGLESSLPVSMKMEEDGKIRIAVNKKLFNAADRKEGDEVWEKEEWFRMKEAYNSLAKKAISRGNAAKAFGSAPASFGAGMVSLKADIMGYGEGYISDQGALCIDVGLILSVEGESKVTNYYFIAWVPFYVTFGGGAKLEAQGTLGLALDGDGLRTTTRGTLEINFDSYVKPEVGVGADGILSVGLYGKITFATKLRVRDNYKKASLKGNLKVKATALLWSKVIAELNGEYVIYDSNRKPSNQSRAGNAGSVNYRDMSGAELIPMDYLSQRNTSSNSPRRARAASSGADSVLLDYAYEDASPRLLRVGTDLYLFYLDGVEGRTAQNQTALFYQKSSDGGITWSEAARVDGNANETADCYYDAVTDGKNIYVIWSDENKVYGDEILSVDSSEAINRMAQDLDLMLAVIDCKTGNIKTRSIATEKADLQPHVAVDGRGVVYVAWVANDMKADTGLFSSENGFSLCYVSSRDNYTQIHTMDFAPGSYPLTMDLGVLGSKITAAVDLDMDQNLDTQEDCELYTWDLAAGGEAVRFTDNGAVDSVPVFASVGGKDTLFWYQDGNIAYTTDGRDIRTVFDGGNLPIVGQEFSVITGDGPDAAILWPAISEETMKVDLFCADFDGSRWSPAYRLNQIDSEYTTSPNGYLNGTDYRAVYLGSVYEGEELVSRIHMLTAEERTDISVSYSAEGKEQAGQAYPLALFVRNTGNQKVDRLFIHSSDGALSRELTGLDLKPGTSKEIAFTDIVLPEGLSDIYACDLTVQAQGETELSDNKIEIRLGHPDLSIDAVTDFSGGDDLASVAVANQGILPADAKLKVYADKEHTVQIYEESFGDIAGNETRNVVFNLTAMDANARAFYLVMEDGSGAEISTADNEAVIWVGKGTEKENTGEKPKATGISATKKQTEYMYGETPQFDDLEVTLNYSDGDSVKISDYTVNADKIDTSTLGKSVLTVSYGNMTAEVAISVIPRVLNGMAAVTLPQASYNYSGTAYEPEPVVLANGVTLQKDVDYTVGYANNVNVGNASVLITGIGNYQGTVEAPFTIRKGAAPAQKEQTIPVFGGTPQDRNVQMKRIFPEQGEITGCRIQSVTEDDTVSTEQVIAETSVGKDGFYFKTNKGAQGDFAVVTIQVSFANYEDTLYKAVIKLADELELEETGNNHLGELSFNIVYLYTSPEKGAITAFTSRMDKDAVTLEYRPEGENGWRTWAYDNMTGNYTLAVAKGARYALRAVENAKTGENGVKAGLPGYKNGNGALSSTFKIGSVTDAELSGRGSADRMSAAYALKGTAFTAGGTLKYIRNCSGYLGADGAYKSGYFLALRLKVQETKFREDGYVSITYLDGEGNRQKQFYEYKDASGTLKDGYVDVILDLNTGLTEACIRVALDSTTNIKTYQLGLSGLEKEESGLYGSVTEAAEKDACGVKTSSPIIKEKAAGEVEAAYSAVSYSADIILGDGTAKKGNYIALKAAIPASMQNTKIMYKYGIEGMDASQQEGLLVSAGIPEGASYVLFIIDAKKGSKIFGEKIWITWNIADKDGNEVEGASPATQKILVKKTENCYFDSIPADAALPKSIAFNGLATAMYVGQSQDIATTIVRKYEEDTVRLSYSSSDSSVLSVNRVTGVIHALRAGTAVVTVEAVSADGQSLARSSRITVKNPVAPASVKVSSVKDTSAAISWGKNVTGHNFEVFAVPYADAYDKETRKTAAKWKEYIEAELNKTGPDGPGWKVPSVTVGSVCTKAEVTGLEADTIYLFYVRNMAETADGRQIYAGSLSGKTTTKKEIFESIKLIPQCQIKDGAGNVTLTDLAGKEFIVKNNGQPGTSGLPNKIGYQLLNKAGQEMPAATVFTQASYKSTDTNVIKVDKNGNLSLGGQAGIAKIYVTGKDASGVMRTSEAEPVVIKVIKAPVGLKAKTTTLAIGQSITLKELINYDGVKGPVTEIDTDGIDFASVLEQIPGAYFAWDKDAPVSGDTKITAAALIPDRKNVPVSGEAVKAADFTLVKMDGDGKASESKAAATIKINAMSAPVIKGAATGDTSIDFTFTTNNTVRELAGTDYYYTVTVKDMVTNGEIELRQMDGGGKTKIISKTGIINDGMTVAFREAPDMAAKAPVHNCTIEGLSSNKKYRVSINAHYDAVNGAGLGVENINPSKTKDFTTKSRLLASEDGIEVSYISLTELKKQPYAEGIPVFKDEGQNPGYGSITLENNETYIFMAQVSNLARAVETDKLKWSISSGDKNAATIKAGASTFEAQLKAARTGTFTVSASSSATKGVLVTFTVTVIPYQSGSEGTAAQAPSAGNTVAYLGGILQDPFREEKKKTA